MKFSRQEYWRGLPFSSLPLGIRETFINSPFIKLFSNYSNLSVPSFLLGPDQFTRWGNLGCARGIQPRFFSPPGLGGWLLLSWMELWLLASLELFMAWSGHESFIKWDPGDSEERQKWYLPESQLDHKEGRKQKNWCFQTMVWEKTFQSLLDSKEIKPVNPKGNQPWILIGRTDAEAPVLWPPDGNSWLIGKDPDAGKDWRQEEKGMTEDEMVAWHHWLNRHESEPTTGNSEGQRSLACWLFIGSQRVGHNLATEQQESLIVSVT